MIELDPSPAPAPVAPKKPSKLMVDLTAAIRATAEAARDQALAQVDTDVATVVEDIRSQSKDGETVLRQRSDEDVVGIREWSKLEIARIKEETEAKIEARKVALASELAAHAAAVERRVDDVQDRASVYRAQMAGYSDGLGQEEDPSRLATMAESMPEPPDLAGWAAMDDDPVTEALHAVAAAEAMHAVAAVAAEPEAAVDWPAVEIEATSEPAQAETEPAAYGDVPETDAPETADPASDVVGVADSTPSVQAPTSWAAEAWGSAPEAWAVPAKGTAVAVEPGDDIEPEASTWAAAKAIVAAEAAEESVTQPEAVADADIVLDAEAAFAARMDADGFDTAAIADRLARMLPAQEDGVVDVEPRTTQVVVLGLVSVASIASFKRHLGRLAGVQAVAVASGPDGEFVFNVTHASNVSFKDAIPALPGFAARVTSAENGVVTVTARDPETES